MLSPLLRASQSRRDHKIFITEFGRVLMKMWPLFLVLLVACQQQVAKEDMPTADFRTGTQGLVMSFAQNAPPATLYETETFHALIELTNLGAADVGSPGDKIYLSGFDPRILTGIPSTGLPVPTIEGKNVYNPRGGFDQVAFRGTIARLQSDLYPAPIVATACYGYETVASESVCIDPQPFGGRLEQKACTPQNVAAGNQGAPVAVRNIEVEARPGKTMFRIAISNVGGGDVFKPGMDSLAKCNPYTPEGLGFEELDYVRLSGVSVGGTSITGSCRPVSNGLVPLRQGQGTVTCELSTSGSAAYVTPITVQLEYGYRSLARRDVTIRRVD